jgi:predicted aldo/keto reductase-like oxidoreductase
MMSKLVELLPAVAKARWILQDDSVMRLVDGMDGTYQVQFLKAVAKQQPSLLKEKEFSKLVKRHAAAIVASR